jgi:hypothetical protein
MTLFGSAKNYEFLAADLAESGADPTILEKVTR